MLKKLLIFSMCFFAYLSSPAAQEQTDKTQGNLNDVLTLLKNESGIEGPLPDLDPGLNVGDFKFTHLAPSKTSISGKLQILGNNSEAIVSLITPAGKNPILLLTVEVQSLTLADLFINLEGRKVGEITLSNIVLSSVLSKNKIATLGSQSLDTETHLMYRAFLGKGDFTINLTESINFLARYHSSDLPEVALSTLGLHPSIPLFIQGGISASLDELLKNKFVHHNQFYATTIAPLESKGSANFPTIFKSVSFDKVQLGLSYSALLHANLSTKMNVEIDNRPYIFDVSFGHRFSSHSKNLEMSALLDGEMKNVFGTKVDLENVSALFTLDDDTKSGTFYGDMQVGAVKARCFFDILETDSGSSITFSTKIEKLDSKGLADLLSTHSNHNWASKLPIELESISDVFLSYEIGNESSFNFSGITTINIDDHAFLVQLAGTVSDGVGTVSMKNPGPMAWHNAFEVEGFSLSDVNYEIDHSQGSTSISLQALSQVDGVNVRTTISSKHNSNTKKNEFTLKVGPVKSIHLSTAKNYLLRFFKNKLDTPSFSLNTPLPNPENLEINNAELSIILGSTNSFNLTASTTYLNRSSDVLLAGFEGSQGTQLITGFKFSDLSAKSLLGTKNSLANSINFPKLAIVDLSGKSEFKSSQNAVLKEFLSDVSSHASTTLSPGLQVFANSKIKQPKINKFFGKLGIDLANVFLVADVGKNGFKFSGKLPNIVPAKEMSFLKKGTLNYDLNISTTDLGISLDGVVKTRLKKKELDFDLGVQLTLGALETFDLSGKMVKPVVWDQAFGIDWLSISETSMDLSFNATTESVGLNMGGELSIGSKLLAADIGIGLNAETGVPDAFKLNASSTSNLGLSDILALQEKMAVSAGIPVSDRIPKNAIPNLELRPVNAHTPLKVDIDTSIARIPSFGVSGSLWVQVLPSEGLVELGQAQVEIKADKILFTGDFEIVGQKISGIDLIIDSSGFHFSSSVGIPFAGSIPSIVTDAAKCGMHWVTGSAQCAGAAITTSFNCATKTFDCETKKVSHYLKCVFTHPKFWECHEKSCKTKQVCDIKCKKPETCTIHIKKSGSLEASYQVNLRKNGVSGSVEADYAGHRLTGGTIKVTDKGIEACIKIPILGNFCAGL